MALKTYEMWSNGVKMAFFFNCKKCPGAGGFAPRPPLVIRFNYSHVFTQHTSPNLDISTF